MPFKLREGIQSDLNYAFLRDFFEREFSHNRSDEQGGDSNLDLDHQLAWGLHLYDKALADFPGNERESIQWWLEQSSAEPIARFFRLARRDVFSVSAKPNEEPQPQSEPQSEPWSDASFDRELNREAKRVQKRHGVYYTPRKLADRLLSRLIESCAGDSQTFTGLLELLFSADGVGDHNPVVLEPSCGDGVFLEAILDRVRIERTTVNAEHGRNENGKYLAEVVLPRLVGIELFLPPLVAAHFRIIRFLKEVGYSFETSTKLNLFWGDTLNIAIDGQTEMRDRVNSQRLTLCAAKVHAGYRLIIGNPPYSALNPSVSRFLQELLKGKVDSPAGEVSYFEVDGQAIKERKSWLHDIYMQFLRYAHWLIDREGKGMIAFVTNKNVLDNVSFRGAREKLCRSFQQVDILELSEDSRKSERRKAKQQAVETKDFEVVTGTCLLMLRKIANANANDALPSLRYQTSWIDSKEETLSGTGKDCSLKPIAPNYLFVPQATSQLTDIYESGFSLAEIVKVRGSVAVTARDKLVVGSSVSELRSRLLQLRDSSISDEEIRQIYFRKSRSFRYSSGNTRGWDLKQTRAWLRSIDVNEIEIKLCHYRPFEFRYVLWHSKLLDWPRNELNSHLEMPDNWGLVTRRLAPRAVDYSFVLATSLIPLDGILRSDNRGNETLIPASLKGEEGVESNLRDEFVARLVSYWEKSAPDDSTGKRKLHGELSLENQIWGAIYAMLHARKYREEFSELLPLGFPRLRFPRSFVEFKKLSEPGLALLNLHLEYQRTVFQAAVSQVAVSQEIAQKVDHAEGLSDIRRTEQVPLSIEQRETIACYDNAIGAHYPIKRWLKSKRKSDYRITKMEQVELDRLAAMMRRGSDIATLIDQAYSSIADWIAERDV